MRIRRTRTRMKARGNNNNDNMMTATMNTRRTMRTQDKDTWRDKDNEGR